jgi:hypothetical protein
MKIPQNYVCLTETEAETWGNRAFFSFSPDKGSKVLFSSHAFAMAIVHTSVSESSSQNLCVMEG